MRWCSFTTCSNLGSRFKNCRSKLAKFLPAGVKAGLSVPAACAFSQAAKSSATCSGSQEPRLPLAGHLLQQGGVQRQGVGVPRYSLWTTSRR